MDGFVKFAELEACNALKIPYKKKFDLFKHSDIPGNRGQWIHRKAQFPLINQSEEEFEIWKCENQHYQSNLDSVISITVENINNPHGREITGQVGTMTQ